MLLIFAVQQSDSDIHIYALTFLVFIIIYLAMLGFSCSMQDLLVVACVIFLLACGIFVVACGIFSGGMRDLFNCSV